MHLQSYFYFFPEGNLSAIGLWFGLYRHRTPKIHIGMAVLKTPMYDNNKWNYENQLKRELLPCNTTLFKKITWIALTHFNHYATEKGWIHFSVHLYIFTIPREAIHCFVLMFVILQINLTFTAVKFRLLLNFIYRMNLT